VFGVAVHGRAFTVRSSGVGFGWWNVGDFSVMGWHGLALRMALRVWLLRMVRIATRLRFWKRSSLKGPRGHATRGTIG
jgi:hypothetical protein